MKLCSVCITEQYCRPDQNECIICERLHELKNPIPRKPRTKRTKEEKKLAARELYIKNRKLYSEVERINIDEIVYDKIMCTSCKLTKHRRFTGQISGGHKTYVNEIKKKWNAKTCPDCVLEKSRKKYNRLPRSEYENRIKRKNINCLQCNKEFKPKRRSIKFCNRNCSGRYIAIHKLNFRKISKPIKYPMSKITYISCEECGIRRAVRTRRKFCSKKCSHKRYRKSDRYKLSRKTPEAKKASKSRKRLRKRQVARAKLKTISWRQIEMIYDNKPLGMEVDHIIPLKGEIVSGLHVPWNFQYLTKEENEFKSNKFDGTLNNEGWRKEYNERSIR